MSHTWQPRLLNRENITDYALFSHFLTLAVGIADNVDTLLNLVQQLTTNRIDLLLQAAFSLNAVDACSAIAFDSSCSTVSLSEDDVVKSNLLNGTTCNIEIEDSIATDEAVVLYCADDYTVGRKNRSSGPAFRGYG